MPGRIAGIQKSVAAAAGRGTRTPPLRTTSTRLYNSYFGVQFNARVRAGAQARLYPRVRQTTHRTNAGHAHHSRLVAGSAAASPRARFLVERPQVDAGRVRGEQRGEPGADVNVHLALLREQRGVVLVEVRARAPRQRDLWWPAKKARANRSIPPSTRQ